MKKSEWNEGLNHIDNDLVANYIAQKEILQKKKNKQKVWLRAIVIAAVLAMIFTAVFTVPMFFGRDSGDLSSDVTDTPDTDYFDGTVANGDRETNEFGCETYISYEDTVDSKSVLKAWAGGLTQDKLKSAINEYTKNYKNIVLPKDTDYKYYFETDFEIKDCRVLRVSAVDENNADYEIYEGGFNFHGQSSYDGKTVKVSLLEYDESMEKHPIVSYVVWAEDSEGVKHCYYFRVDYSNLKTKVNQETEQNQETEAVSYKLTISKTSAACIENDVKEYYAPGEIVSVKLKQIDGTILFYVDDVHQDYVKSTSEYVTYMFVMPARDVNVKIETWYVVKPVEPENGTSAIEVYVENGVIYFEQFENVSAVLQLDEGDVTIEDDTFVEKLGAAINGKEVIKCECAANYHVEIDDTYFYFHEHGIEISVLSKKSTSTNGSMNIYSVSYTSYSVNCSEEELAELIAILEATKSKIEK